MNNLQTLRDLRSELGYSTTFVGKKIGVSHASVSRWETAYDSPKIDKILDLAIAYETTPEKILRCWINTQKTHIDRSVYNRGQLAA